jgi:hypothetical protein
MYVCVIQCCETCYKFNGYRLDVVNELLSVDSYTVPFTGKLNIKINARPQLHSHGAVVWCAAAFGQVSQRVCLTVA